jgi:hypothetical protein
LALSVPGRLKEQLVGLWLLLVVWRVMPGLELWSR